MPSLNTLKGVPCGVDNSGTTRVVYAQDGSVAIFCDAPPPPALVVYTGVSVSGQFATVTFDRKVCRTGPVTVADWDVENVSSATTVDVLGTSIPECNAAADNGVLSGFLVLAVAAPNGSFIAVTLTAVGGASHRDQAGVNVSAPQTRTATATAPETTAPTIRSASGDVGSTTIVLGFSKDVYCTGFSFNSEDIVITDNNPATQDPVVTGMGGNSCGVTVATADASFSMTLSTPLAASRSYSVQLSPEANEIQDTTGNDLLNPSEISFTTAAGDFIPPTLVDTRLLSNVITTDFSDVGDRFQTTFSEVMSMPPFGVINVQDADGSTAFLSCGGQVSCTWNPAGMVITVTITSPIALSLFGSTPGLQVPLTITTLNGFFDLQGNSSNLSGSPDRIIDDEAGTAPRLGDARVVNNLGTSDLADVGDAFSMTFGSAMSASPTSAMGIQDQDGTFAFLTCGTNIVCLWNIAGTELTVTIITPVAANMGFTPGLQLPTRITILGGITDFDGNAPDLAGSTDTLIDYE